MEVEALEKKEDDDDDVCEREELVLEEGLSDFEELRVGFLEVGDFGRVLEDAPRSSVPLVLAVVYGVAEREVLEPGGLMPVVEPLVDHEPGQAVVDNVEEFAERRGVLAHGRARAADGEGERAVQNVARRFRPVPARAVGLFVDVLGEGGSRVSPEILELVDDHKQERGEKDELKAEARGVARRAVELRVEDLDAVVELDAPRGGGRDDVPGERQELRLDLAIRGEHDKGRAQRGPVEVVAVHEHGDDVLRTSRVQIRVPVDGKVAGERFMRVAAVRL